MEEYENIMYKEYTLDLPHYKMFLFLNIIMMVVQMIDEGQIYLTLSTGPSLPVFMMSAFSKLVMFVLA